MLTVAPVGKKQKAPSHDPNTTNKDITDIDQGEGFLPMSTFAGTPGSGGRNDASNILGHVQLNKQNQNDS